MNDNRSLYPLAPVAGSESSGAAGQPFSNLSGCGLFEQSVREAARAVSSDYANYSAHLFLQ